MKTTVTVKDIASARLIRLESSLADRRDLLTRLGMIAQNYLKAHFDERERQPNRKGWPKQHFWAGVSTATRLRSVDNSRAVVGIASRAFAHKVSGGTIRPLPGKKFLAIPLRADASGKMPRGDSTLFFMRSRRGRMLLAKKGRDGREAVRPYYRLVPSVTHRPDPRALPDMARLNDILIARTRAYTEKQNQS